MRLTLRAPKPPSSFTAQEVKWEEPEEVKTARAEEERRRQEAAEAERAEKAALAAKVRASDETCTLCGRFCIVAERCKRDQESLIGGTDLTHLACAHPVTLLQVASAAAAHAERQRAFLAVAGHPGPPGPAPPAPPAVPPPAPPPGFFPPPHAAAMFPGLHSHMAAQAQAQAAAAQARSMLPEEEFEIPEFSEEDVKPRAQPPRAGRDAAAEARCLLACLLAHPSLS